jgi:rhamnose transport system permease protein
MRLETISTNYTNITIGLLLIGSVISTSVLSWVSGSTSGRVRRGRSGPAAAPPQDTSA